MACQFIGVALTVPYRYRGDDLREIAGHRRRVGWRESTNESGTARAQAIVS